jgi:hypothetical protein
MRVAYNKIFGKLIAPPNKRFSTLTSNNHPATFVQKGIYSSMGLFDTSYKIAADIELIMRFQSNPKIKIGKIDSTLTYMLEEGISGGITGIRESYDIEKKYNSRILAFRVLFRKIRQKLRKKIIQSILPKSMLYYIQQKWWKNKRDLHLLSDNDFWLNS